MVILEAVIHDMMVSMPKAKTDINHATLKDAMNELFLTHKHAQIAEVDMMKMDQIAFCHVTLTDVLNVK